MNASLAEYRSLIQQPELQLSNTVIQSLPCVPALFACSAVCVAQSVPAGGDP